MASMSSCRRVIFEFGDFCRVERVHAGPQGRDVHPWLLGQIVWRPAVAERWVRVEHNHTVVPRHNPRTPFGSRYSHETVMCGNRVAKMRQGCQTSTVAGR